MTATLGPASPVAAWATAGQGSAGTAGALGERVPAGGAALVAGMVGLCKVRCDLVGPGERLVVGGGEGGELDGVRGGGVEVAAFVVEREGEQAAFGSGVVAQRGGGALVEGQFLEQPADRRVEQRVDDREEADGEGACRVGGRAGGEQLAQPRAQQPDGQQ